MWEIIFNTSLTLEDFKKMNKNEFYECFYAYENKCKREKEALEKAKRG